MGRIKIWVKGITRYILTIILFLEQSKFIKKKYVENSFKFLLYALVWNKWPNERKAPIVIEKIVLKLGNVNT